MVISFRLPKVPSGLGANLLGVAGFVAIVVAVGMLAGLAWAILGAGVIAVGLAVIAQMGEQQAQRTTEALSEATAALPQVPRRAA